MTKNTRTTTATEDVAYELERGCQAISAVRRMAINANGDEPALPIDNGRLECLLSMFQEHFIRQVRALDGGPERPRD